MLHLFSVDRQYDLFDWNAIEISTFAFYYLPLSVVDTSFHLLQSIYVLLAKLQKRGTVSSLEKFIDCKLSRSG